MSLIKYKHMEIPKVTTAHRITKFTVTIKIVFIPGLKKMARKEIYPYTSPHKYATVSKGHLKPYILKMSIKCLSVSYTNARYFPKYNTTRYSNRNFFPHYCCVELNTRFHCKFIKNKT